MWAAKWGGVIGGSFGAVGGILGALTGVFANRGKAKGLILGMWAVFVCISGICLVAGIVALVCRQSFWVYYPLLLSGFIGTMVGIPLMQVTHGAYAQSELRRMHAQDAVGGGGK